METANKEKNISCIIENGVLKDIVKDPEIFYDYFCVPKTVRKVELDHVISGIDCIYFPDNVEEISMFISKFRVFEISDTTHLNIKDSSITNTQVFTIRNSTGSAFVILKNYLKKLADYVHPSIIIKENRLTLKEEMKLQKMGVRFKYKELRELEIKGGISLSDDNWIIEDGVLKLSIKRYKGGVITIPEGVKKIESNAFANPFESGNSITVIFPESLVEIKDAAFVSYSIEEVKLSKNVRIIGEGAFILSKIKKLTISSTTRLEKEVFPSTLEELYIINEGSLIEFVKSYFDPDYFKNLKRVVILNKMSIKEIFSVTWFFTSIEHIELRLEDKEEKRGDDVLEGNDNKSLIEEEKSEVSSLVDEVRGVVELLEESSKQKIFLKVDRLLKKYKDDLEYFNPDNALNEEISLTLGKDADTLRIDLTIALRNIIDELKRDDLLSELEKLNDFKSMLNRDISLPTTIETDKDKVTLIISIAREANRQLLLDELASILEHAIDNCSKTLASRVVRDNENPFSSQKPFNIDDVRKKIDELFIKCGRFSLNRVELEGFGNSHIAFFIRKIKDLIAKLDMENKKKYLERLQEITSKYEFKKDFNEDDTSLYKELLLLVEELSSIVSTSTYYKNILDSINMVLYDDPKYLQKSCLTSSLSLDILKLLESNNISPDRASAYKEKLKNILRKFKKIILDEEIIEVVKNYRKLVTEIGDEASTIEPLHIENFTDISVLDLIIGKELTALKFEIEDYLDKKKHYIKLSKV